MGTESVDNKCPSCNASIKFNPTTQNWKCEYCGMEYTVEDFEKKQSKEKKTSKKTDDSNIELEQYNCSNCGAIVVTDKETTATFCVYCGSTTIMKNRLEGTFKPDKLIPFKTTKQDAIEEFKKCVKRQWFAPKTFSDEQNIQKITGVYVPFWLYDSGATGSIVAACTRSVSHTSGNYRTTTTSHYICDRSGEMTFTDVPADASSKFDDAIMDSIEPYDYKDFVPFNRSYLSGFLAEKYNQTQEEVYKRAEERIKNSFVRSLENTITGYGTRVVTSSTVNLTKGDVEYALLPVWMLNVKYKDKMHTFAMNGQTKKCVGNVPIDFGKLVRKTSICLGLSFIIGAAIRVLIGLGSL